MSNSGAKGLSSLAQSVAACVCRFCHQTASPREDKKILPPAPFDNLWEAQTGQLKEDSTSIIVKAVTADKYFNTREHNTS
jgi:hypothetical protein